MKKLLCTSAVIVLTIIMAVTAFAKSNLPFTDVAENSWYYSSVSEAYEKGLMTGMTETTFSPLGNLTRAQYVVLLYRIADGSASTPDFKDVKPTAWYADAVGWAQKTGVVGGFDDGSFKPDNKINRQELMVMTARYLDYAWLKLPDADKNEIAPKFTDSDSIASWAKDGVEYMRLIGLVKGDNKGQFNPKNTATRAETATLVLRLYNSVEKYSVAPSINGTALTEYKLYTDYGDFADLTQISETIKNKSGISLSSVDNKTEKCIVFTVDDNLKMLEYAVNEKDGNLVFSVYTKYALPYMPEIVESFLSERKVIDVPADFGEKGTYTIDSYYDLPEGSKIQYAGETDKNPLSYSCGDSVCFRISVLYNNRLISLPYLNLEFKRDSEKTTSTIVPCHTGQVVATFEGLKNPGTAMLKVTPYSKKQIPIASIENQFIGSVAFDFNDITTAVEKPSDFDEFWDSQVDKIMKFDYEVVRFEECSTYSRAGYKTYDVELTTMTSDHAYIHITVPENADANSLIIRASFSAYGFGDVGPSYGNYIGLTVNPHNLTNDREQSYYDEASKSINCWIDKDDTREDCYMMGMLTRDILAIRFTEEQFGDIWDNSNITSAGGSMAGFQATAIAGLVDKVTYLEDSITWMCDIGGNTVNRIDGWCPNYSKAAVYFDSCYFASRIDKNCIVSLYGGLGDTTCPPTGLIALYNALDVDNKAASFSQNAGHGSSGGVYNKSYTVFGSNPTFAKDDTIIKDNGYAVAEPVYSVVNDNNGRTLTALETQLKTAAETMKKKTKWIKIESANSEYITVELLSNLILSELKNKYSLPANTTIEIDVDDVGTQRSYFQTLLEGDTGLQFIDYILHDSNGGHYWGNIGLNYVKLAAE